jgi:long-chain acyl-CoA synthetase
LLGKVAEHNGLKGFVQFLEHYLSKNWLNNRFERMKKIHLSLKPFSVEDNTLTPTLKVRRKDVYQKYKKEIDGLYEGVSKL